MLAGTKTQLALASLLISTAVVYFDHLGRASFSANEAYSILAANQPDLRHVVEAALAYDPGKPPLYQVLLHWFVGRFGAGEVSARTFSVFASIVSVFALYKLAERTFDSRVALLGASLWAFSPLAVMMAQWARMYSLLSALSVLVMLTLWRARRLPTPGNLAGFTLSVAALLYVHMAGMLCLAATLTIALGDCLRGSTNAVPIVVAILAALVLFIPFLGIEIAQAGSLLHGHWLDWAGTPGSASGWNQLLAIALIASTAATFVWSVRARSSKSDALIFYLIWSLVPALAIFMVSLVFRPIFTQRYFVVSVPPAAILLAYALILLPRGFRIAGCVLIFAVFFLAISIFQLGRREPWRLITIFISQADGENQPIFFESGSLVRVGPPRDDGFPNGYFRVPFDLYFKGSAPRLTIDSSQPEAARQQIGAAAIRYGGAWLISGKPESVAQNELPKKGFAISRMLQDRETILYHVVPSATGKDTSRARPGIDRQTAVP
ncbi:MAG: glycosyltransferase family 39 protein [Candidatus Binataceae bacterium]